MEKKKILLISENVEMLADWQHCLRNWRYYYNVSAADTPEAATEALNRAPPDLAVLDAAFPIGLEICRERRVRAEFTLIADGGGVNNCVYWLTEAQADGYVRKSDRRDMFEAKIGALTGVYPINIRTAKSNKTGGI